MDIGGLEVIVTGSRLLTAEEVAELTEHIEQLQAANHEMWVRMTHMELHECPGCANVADLQEALEENAKLRTALIAVLQCNGITKRDKGCEVCPMYDKEREYVWAGDWCGIRRFISELGIEVSDG